MRVGRLRTEAPICKQVFPNCKRHFFNSPVTGQIHSINQSDLLILLCIYFHRYKTLPGSGKPITYESRRETKHTIAFIHTQRPLAGWKARRSTLRHAIHIIENAVAEPRGHHKESLLKNPDRRDIITQQMPAPRFPKHGQDPVGRVQ